MDNQLKISLDQRILSYFFKLQGLKGFKKIISNKGWGKGEKLKRNYVNLRKVIG